jgi:RTC4-like domain
MKHLTFDLRSAAGKDWLVNRAPPTYMLQVLVPATVLRLTMEDMDVDKTKALATMKASSESAIRFSGSSTGD